MYKTCIIIGCIACLAIQGCDNDVPILAEEKEIPIVYCLLDPHETENHVRINRSSQDLESSESFEFEGEIKIKITEIYTGNEAEFSRIDEFDKDDAMLPIMTKHNFETNFEFKPEFNYFLEIYFTEYDLTVTAETYTIGHFNFIEPHPDRERLIDFATEDQYTAQWTTCENAYVYQVNLHFLYYEIENTDTIEKEIVYHSQYVLGDGKLLHEINNGNVFTQPWMIYLGENIEKKENIRRKARGVVFEITAGNEHYAVFLENLNLNITLNNLNLASNISNGLGIFGSVYSIYSDTLPLSSNTIDSIAYGQYTKDLKFFDRWGNLYTN